MNTIIAVYIAVATLVILFGCWAASTIDPDKPGDWMGNRFLTEREYFMGTCMFIALAWPAVFCFISFMVPFILLRATMNLLIMNLLIKFFERMREKKGKHHEDS